MRGHERAVGRCLCMALRWCRSSASWKGLPQLVERVVVPDGRDTRGVEAGVDEAGERLCVDFQVGRGMRSAFCLHGDAVRSEVDGEAAGGSLAVTAMVRVSPVGRAVNRATSSRLSITTAAACGGRVAEGSRRTSMSQV